MKTMTCKQLGGACDKEFHANTFEEMANLSKEHGMQMFQTQDQGHMQAMQRMQELMKDPNAMQNWMQEKKELFDSLPQTDPSKN